MRYVAFFVLIQAVNIPLMVAGWFLCALPYKAIPWLWRNDEDGAGPRAGWLHGYVWLAWRNPVANFKHVPGVSKVGRPLWYWSNQRWYFKAGWMSDGYPCLSAGSGRGY